MLRTETPCDLIPAMSSPHTGDVAFLFGALWAFPHLLLDRAFNDERRYDLSLRLRDTLRLMHGGSDDEVQREMPAVRNDSVSCAAAAADIDSSRFWRMRDGPVQQHVLRMRDGAAFRSTLVEPEEADRVEERRILNQAWDSVMVSLLQLRF